MSSRLRQVLGHLHRLLVRVHEDSDGHLLDRFLHGQDETAFTMLVQRHGPMVLGVCRRVLLDADAAEDAFQVTFLTLARKAQALRRQQALAGWLCRVALHVSLRARARAARQRTRERTAPVMPRPEPLAELSWRELGPVLDEELDRLPEKLRAPLVLCGLEGKTNEEAARTLGWPAGSISKRLAQGRELLRQRLARRGFVVGSAGLATLFETDSAAAVPGPLLEATVREALPFVCSPETALAALPPSVANLLEETMRALLWSRIKTLALLLTVALLGTAAGLGLWSVSRAEPLAAAPTAPAAAQPVADKPAAARADGDADALPPGAIARLGTARGRHGSAVLLAGFTADGKQVVSVGQNGTVRLWDLDGKRTQSSELPEKWQRAALSGDGQLLAVVVAQKEDEDVPTDTVLRLLETTTGKERATFPLPKRTFVEDLRFTPDGKALVSREGNGEKSALVVRETATGKERRQIPFTERGMLGFTGNAQPLESMAISHDSKQVAVAVPQGAIEHGTIHVFDLTSGATVRSLDHIAICSHVACSPTRPEMAWVDAKDFVHRYDIATGKEIAQLGDGKGGRGFGNRLAYSPDGKQLAAYGLGGKGLSVWDLASGKELRRFGATTFGTTDPYVLAFSPDGQLLATGGSDHAVRVWDVVEGKPRGALPGHGGPIQALGLTADSKSCVILDSDGMVRQWALTDGKEQRSFRLPANAPTPSTLSRGGPLLALSANATTLAWTSDEKIRLWDVATDKERRSLALPKPERTPHFFAPSVLLSPGGKELAATSTRLDGALLLWNAADGKEWPGIAKPDNGGEFESAYALPTAFTPDGNVLLTRGHYVDAVGRAPELQVQRPKGMRWGYSTLRAWDAKTGKPLQTFPTDKHYFSDVAVSPDSRSLAVSCIDKVILIFEVETGKERSRVSADATVVAFNADNRILAGAERDGTIRLWDTVTSKEVGQFRGHQGNVRALAFTPDGRLLVSGSDDTTALVWDMASLRGKEPK